MIKAYNTYLIFRVNTTLSLGQMIKACFVVTFFITLLSCEKEIDDDIIFESNIKTSFVSLKGDIVLQNMVSNLTAANSKFSVANEEPNIFSYADWDVVTKLVDSRPEYNRTVYSAYLKNRVNDHIMDNLIISKVEEKEVGMIIRYRAEEGWFQNNTIFDNMDVFTGYVEFMTLEGEVFAKSKFRDGTSYIPTNGSSGCDSWVVIDYSAVHHLDGGGHWDVEFVSWNVSEFIPCGNSSGTPTDLFEPGPGFGGGGPGGGSSGYIGPAFPVSSPNLLKPCPANPLPFMAIARQEASGIKGGRFGPNRTKKNGGIKNHLGTDVKTILNDPIYSMFAGTVEQVGYEAEGLGHYIVIKSKLNGRDIYTYYAHLQTPNISVGTIVATGAEIGKSGSSGNLGAAVLEGKTEQHTHIIIRDSDVPDNHSRGAKVDPEDFFNTPFDDNGNRMDSQLSCMNTVV